MTPATLADMLRRADSSGEAHAEDVQALVLLVARLWPLAAQAAAPTLDAEGRLVLGADYEVALDGLTPGLRAALMEHPMLPEDLAAESPCARCGDAATGLCEPCTRAVWGDVPCGEGPAPRRPR